MLLIFLWKCQHCAGWGFQREVWSPWLLSESLNTARRIVDSCHNPYSYVIGNISISPLNGYSVNLMYRFPNLPLKNVVTTICHPEKVNNNDHNFKISGLTLMFFCS